MKKFFADSLYSKRVENFNDEKKELVFHVSMENLFSFLLQ